MKVEPLALTKASSPQEASTPPRILVAGSLANIEVKEASDGEPVLLEVNPYLTGTMPLASGVSMLKLCVDGVLADD